MNSFNFVDFMKCSVVNNVWQKTECLLYKNTFFLLGNEITKTKKNILYKKTGKNNRMVQVVEFIFGV